MYIKRLLCGLTAALLIISAPVSGLTVSGSETGTSTEYESESESGSAACEASDRGLTDVTGITGYPVAPEVTADSILLMEVQSGTILYQKNGSVSHYPASITKIMTALLVIENCSLDEIVTFSYRATHELEEGSSSIARTEGEQMTVRDCLYAMLVASANEVAQALAEHVSGSFEAFADLMNSRAAELGCTGTHFTNPSGLHDDNHYTTCRDMALIMAEAVKNPTFVEINSTTSYTVPATNKHSESFGVAMKHELLRGDDKYEYAKCGKTGYTSKSGFTLVTYAVKDDMELVCVAMNCSSSAQRSESTRNLFNYAFNNYVMYNVSAAEGSVSSTGESDFLDENLISLSVRDESYMILPSSLAFDGLERRLTWNASAGADGTIAYVDYYYGQELVGYAPLMIDVSSDGTYDFLTDGTYEEVPLQEEETSDTDAVKLIIIAISAVLVLVILAALVNIFINGSSRKRRKKKRHAGVSPRIKRYK